MSSEREALKAGFLQFAGFGDARREPLGGDASTRQYERLYRADGTSFIFMDQPPSQETAPCPPGATPAQRAALGYNALARLAAGRVDAFVAVAGWLREQGLSAPAILAADPAKGLAVLEDLGDDLFARLIENGQDEAPLYDAAISALARIHEAPVPDVFAYDGVSWPFLSYDETALATADRLFVEWLPKFKDGLEFDADALAEWEAIWAPIRAYGAANATVFCHRDYHAENLLWLPDRDGAARVGLLDFQDAVRAHPAWDMSMLLHDARRQVTPEREAACLEAYFALRPQVDRARFVADFNALGALNICRILGIFARLAKRDGKPRYARFMPRLWAYLDRCVADPGLARLKAWLDRHVPPSARTIPGPRTAMVLAAGLGTRMRPLTDARPKALVPVAGKALIDHVLDRLRDAGVERVVVNVHHLADQMETHLAGRGDLEVLISDERQALLDSGGGIRHAADKLGRDPIFVANIDSLWTEGGTPALESLKAAWDPEAMDILLLLVKRGQGIGFEGPQGFFRDGMGRLTHSTAPEPATPFANMGIAILKPELLDDQPAGAFSIIPIWHRLQALGRLHGAAMDGFWMHVGDPDARDLAEARLASEPQLS